MSKTTEKLLSTVKETNQEFTISENTYSLAIEADTTKKISNTFETNTNVKEIYQKAVAYDRKKDIEKLAKKWDSIDEFANDGDYEKTISFFFSNKVGDNYIIPMVALCSKEGISNLKERIIDINLDDN